MQVFLHLEVRRCKNAFLGICACMVIKKTKNNNNFPVPFPYPACLCTCDTCVFRCLCMSCRIDLMWTSQLRTSKSSSGEAQQGSDWGSGETTGRNQTGWLFLFFFAASQLDRGCASHPSSLYLSPRPPSVFKTRARAPNWLIVDYLWNVPCRSGTLSAIKLHTMRMRVFLAEMTKNEVQH